MSIIINVNRRYNKVWMVLKMSLLKSETKVYDIPICLIKTSPLHPRKNYDEKKLNRLVKSIIEIGVLQPLVVRKIDCKYFEVVIGERRLRASKIAGFSSVPCIVLNCDNIRSIIYSLTENEVKEDLTIFESSNAYKKLIIDYCLSVEDISNVITISNDLINRFLKMLKFTDVEQKLIEKYDIPYFIAEEVLVLEDPSKRIKVLNKVGTDKFNRIQTKLYVEVIAHPEENKKEEIKHNKIHKFFVSDSRIFINTLNNTIDKINLASIGAKCVCSETLDEINYQISIPKSPVNEKIA